MKKLLTFFPALLYGIVISIRNAFYDRGWFASHHFDQVKTIVVGNLAVGGTGKSPLVNYLIKQFLGKTTLGTLSRGYGRKSQGFKWVISDSMADEVGDEPLTYKTNFPDLAVAVCESRVAGIQDMLNDQPELKTIILDDAFQHRALKADVQIVCTTFDQPYFEDHLMPMGRLREWREGIQRADMVLVTRCPASMTEKQKSKFRTHIPQPVFFASIRYASVQGNSSARGIKIWHALAGIADPSLFFDQVKRLGNLASMQSFPDHHRFSTIELKELELKASTMSSQEAFITTQKDYIRLQAAFDDYPRMANKMMFLPMEMYFLEDEAEFWASLNKALSR
ncbi:tetraacyldisaccharide 4'-kinase [Aquirufa rosea]|uniref:Tetraacyldisaccharide 4'-kinase n=1 Tax=Aquirufa rosea TaxID=2509241 RepID=A0A4V1M591_9BACT|nr:tetraacyldisaccharide 4'-kinase [Aquirufa rosea]RXK47530.1 tetraacyldisaccharide 4'-kinase [Aquirufa rosea]